MSHLFIIFHQFLIDIFISLNFTISFLCVFVSIYFSVSQFFFFGGLDQVFIYSLVYHFSLDQSIWTEVDQMDLSGLKLTEVDPERRQWTE